MSRTGKRIHTLVWIAAMTAILEVSKAALNGIANVELITLLVILFTRHFGWKPTLAAVLLFAVLESMWWGLSIWTITYFYIWPLLVWLAHSTAKDTSLFSACVLSGGFGLLFGALCSLTTLVTAGPRAAFAWWVAGIPYDLIHGASNALICFVLYKPLNRILRRFHPGIRAEEES
ncbi:MAG: hypothetical protein IKS32_10060 [Solobacterium sp.]|nr:hypothetical protein [Solobacterium sp.]